MEDMRDGNLAQKIKENKFLQTNTVKIYTYQILKGLEYLHCIKKVIHRDIKPDNILVSGSGKIKLSDFGEAKFLEESTGTIKGTIAYMAPEIVKVRLGYKLNPRKKKHMTTPRISGQLDVWFLKC
jgi:serine/threonine protein kinase